MNFTQVFMESIKTPKEELFEHITPYEIYCNLIGHEIEVGQIILSPIRRDNRPTFVLFVPFDKDEVYFKDFAWVGGNVFKFIKLYAIYKEGKTLTNMYDIVTYIDNKLGLGIYSDNDTASSYLIKKKLDSNFYSSKRIIKFKSRPFTKRDLQYWKRYHVTEKTLELYNVRSVHKLLNEKNEVTYTVPKNTLTFAYVINSKAYGYQHKCCLKGISPNNCFYSTTVCIKPY